MPESQDVTTKLSCHEIRKYIELELERNNLTLRNRIQTRLKRKWAQDCRCIIRDIDYGLHSLRNRDGSHPNLLNNNCLREFTQPAETDIYKYCVKHRLERGAPQFEREACTKMIDKIETFSSIGKSAIFGTPTAVSYSSKTFHLCFDNLFVAFTLNRKSKRGVNIYIGNAVDPPKAEEKAKLWASSYDLPGARIFIAKVDAEFFRNHVNKIAREQKLLGNLAVITLLTSGAWIGSTKTYDKWKLDLNFEDPARELTNKYDNLHILAMSRSSLHENPFGFEVLHLHNGKTEVLK